MGKVILLGNPKDINKDIDLCYTTSESISNQAFQLLIENQIPFSKTLMKIPFFLKKKFRGSNYIYIINTNKNRYSQARRTIDQMDPVMKRRLVLSNY